MIEKDVEITCSERTLAGTLCSPHDSGIFPTVLFLHGSGNIDRDDNMPGQPLNNSKTIAHYLAENGIASFRYDKRGVGKSTGNYYSAGHFDLVGDGMSCLEYLSSNELCDENSLFLIGHSEGAIIVPQMSQRQIKVAGIILLSPFFETLGSIMMAQARAVKKMVALRTGFRGLLFKGYCYLSDPVKAQGKFLKKLENSSKVVERLAFQKVPAKWFRELLAVDPEEIFAKTNCPSLVIGGAKDFQCDPADVARIAGVIAGPVESHVIEDMSHLLRYEPDEPSVFNYAKQAKQPLMPEVPELILNWLKQQLV